MTPQDKIMFFIGGVWVVGILAAIILKWEWPRSD